MSQAADLLAEVKAQVGVAEKALKAFERDHQGREVAQFTDFAHLNIARIHVGEFIAKVALHRSNAEHDELNAVADLGESPAAPVESAETPDAPPATPTPAAAAVPVADTPAPASDAPPT